MRHMNQISRRGFLATAGGLAATLTSDGLHADPLGMPIGCQTWPVRQTIGKDLDGTLKELAGMGYQRIELCSPPGYKDTGFGPLGAMKGSELRDKIQSAGIKCESCHFGYGELKDHLDERIGWAKDLGLKQMIISTFGLPKSATLADWMKAADAANKWGAVTKKEGIQLGFHNHDFEFHKIDDQLIYDKLMSEFDPDLVKMQFQVGVIELGYKAQDFFTKYPGRFISMHMQDWSPQLRKSVPMGQGVVDWKAVFAAAKTGGVKNYFVEMDPPELRASVPFLHTLS
jgi:sugar phosphate isomerase/epimerase